MEVAPVLSPEQDLAVLELVVPAEHVERPDVRAAVVRLEPAAEREVAVGHGEVGVHRVAVVAGAAGRERDGADAGGGQRAVGGGLGVGGHVEPGTARVHELDEAGQAHVVERGAVAEVVEEGLEGPAAEGQLVAAEGVDALRHDVDDAHQGARAVDDGAGPAHDLDALDVVDGQVEVDGGGAAEDVLVEADPVEEHEDVLGAAARQGRGHGADHDAAAADAVRDHLHARHRLQQLLQRARARAPDVLLAQHGDQAGLVLRHAGALLARRHLQERVEVDVLDVLDVPELLDQAGPRLLLLRLLGRRRFGRGRGHGRGGRLR